MIHTCMYACVLFLPDLYSKINELRINQQSVVNNKCILNVTDLMNECDYIYNPTTVNIKNILIFTNIFILFSF